MSEVLLIATLASILADSAPIIFASLGETLNERAGVVNLSVEGTMMLSAMVAFATAFVLDGYGPMVYFGADLAPYITVGAGFAAAMVAGALIALVVAFGSITLRRDQVAVGFIMTLLATDLCSFAGVGFVR